MTQPFVFRYLIWGDDDHVKENLADLLCDAYELTKVVLRMPVELGVDIQGGGCVFVLKQPDGFLTQDQIDGLCNILSIEHSICMGRITKEKTVDKRFKRK